ncbi:hypothetical protein AVEN_79828-1 [Araneus ventricosus]|uniref:Uncharacterized protein n=1 Tax=Araneus ventricosus TaxID=182803 RepID=A0A4Y2EXI2_ARAVE|nr:hypothetical protein AVEN_79828-1 [Araneus ventricosus]
MGSQSKLFRGINLLIYKTRLQPLATYASAIYTSTAGLLLSEMESLQSIKARQISDVSWFVRNRKHPKSAATHEHTSTIKNPPEISPRNKDTHSRERDMVPGT